MCGKLRGKGGKEVAPGDEQLRAATHMKELEAPG